MTSTTWIKNADWIVASDPQTGGHTYIPNGDLVFSGNQVTFAGRGYGGGADTIINGTDLMVMPGLMNLHVHCFHELHFKGFFEDPRQQAPVDVPSSSSTPSYWSGTTRAGGQQLRRRSARC